MSLIHVLLFTILFTYALLMLPRNVKHPIILVVMVITVSYFTTFFREGFVVHEIPEMKDIKDKGLGAKPDHLELAYSLCENKADSSCQDYVHHYDMLKAAFKRLRKGFCRENPKRCEKLGI